MISKELKLTGWVTENGAYGIGRLVLFDPSKYSEPLSYLLENSSDSERFELTARALGLIGD